MQRRLIAAVIAIAVAIISIFFLVSYVRSADSRAQAKLEPISVLVVTASIPKGTPAQIGASVEVRAVPKSAVPNGSVKSFSDIQGRVAAVELHPGEIVLSERFIEPNSSSSDEVKVPEDAVLVTIPLASERVLGGYLAAGDRVGVIITSGSTTKASLHGILVARMQNAQHGETGNGQRVEGPALVTLAVPTDVAEKIVWSAENASIWLTAERPGSNITGAPAPIAADDAFGKGTR